MVGPYCEGEGAGGFSVIADWIRAILIGEGTVGEGIGCCLLVTGVADNKPDVIFRCECNALGYI